MAKLIKCCVCNVDDFTEEEIVKYNRRNYCYPCLEEKLKPDEFDKHMFYLRFERLFNRKPTKAEWAQCNNLLGDTHSEGEWTWVKIEKVLSYVYEIERLEISSEHGAIGILPYYEYKADKFYEEYYEIYDMAYEVVEEREEEKTVRFKMSTSKPKKLELKSVDKLINWEEEDEDQKE